MQRAGRWRSQAPVPPAEQSNHLRGEEFLYALKAGLAGSPSCRSPAGRHPEVCEDRHRGVQAGGGGPSRALDCRSPYAGPRVLAVIATSLVPRVLWCGFLIGWFLRSIRCFGRAWRLGSSSTMPRSRPVVIASKGPVGWLRREVLDLVEAGTSRVGV